MFDKKFKKLNSCTEFWLKFIQHYGVENGRERYRVKLNDFIRVNKQFEKSGFVMKTPRKRSQTKRSVQNQEKIKKF